MRWQPGMYFSSVSQAQQWLPFDADEDEQEISFVASPKQFREWEKWKSEAESGDGSDW